MVWVHGQERRCGARLLIRLRVRRSPTHLQVGSLGLVNNERLYLDFKPPWPQPWVPDPDSAPPKGGGGDKKKGGKKKK